MSLTLHYKFDQSDVTIDSSGNSIVPTPFGTVTSSTDATYGTVAYFDGSSGFTISSPPSSLLGSSARTISTWGKRENITEFHYIHAGTSGNDFQRFWGRFQANDNTYDLRYANGNDGVAKAIVTTPSAPFGVDEWFHIVTTFDGTTVNVYVNGVLVETEVPLSTLNTVGNFFIGHADGGSHSFRGQMSDFRTYDASLDATAVSQLFADGPNGANVPTFNATPFTHLVDLDWGEISGATTYYLKFIKDGGNEESLATTTELAYVANNLVPDSSYEFRVYSDLDLVTAFYMETVSTPLVDSTSVASLLQRLGNNITLISSASFADIDSFLETTLTTGETVITGIGSTTFVKNSETLTLPDVPKTQVLTSFDQSSGSGQTVSILLPDTSTNVITYDESTDEISVGGTTYTIGTSFILGGQKVTPKDI